MFFDVLNKTRMELAVPLQQQPKVSFERMLPTIVHMHIVQEIEYFGTKLMKKKTPDFSSWKKWADKKALTIDDYERLTGIYTSLLKIGFDSDTLLREEIAKEWLEVAKICRKTGELFRAQIVCSRVSQWKMCSTTTIESAKSATRSTK